MSTAIPSRTRSLRKPSDIPGSSRYGRVSTTTEGEPAPRNGQSPSRLPVKPPTRSTTSTTTRPPSSTGSITSHASMGPPPPRANTSKPAVAATTSGLQRSSSTRRPSDASSTSTGLQRAPSTRRPSVTSSTTTTTDPVKQDRSRPPMVQSRHLRSGSTSTTTNTVPPPTRHLRSGSTSTSTSVRAPPPSGHKRSSSLIGGSNTRPPSVEIHQKPLRPSSTETNLPPPQLQSQPQLSRKANFSTYQQHFSPAKNLAPKPHPAAFLAPPSPSKLPSNIAISAETAKLQNELLGLHILHKDIDTVSKEWKSSAKRKMGSRFQDVANKHSRLLLLESEEMGRVNALALKSWGGSTEALEEKIQILNETITGIWNLSENGGKYLRLVRKFEKWMFRRQEILDARARHEGLENDEVVFLEELDIGWKEECANVGRRLEMWGKNLRVLGGVDEEGGKTDLGTVLDGFARLVEGMMEELEAMGRIERDSVAMEAQWIKSMNEDGMEEDEIDTPVAGAIWRSR